MKLIKFLAVSSLVFSFSCTPDPLEGFEADAGTKTKSDVTVSDDTSNNVDTGGEASAEFKFVADSFRAKCGQVTCHGASSTNGLIAVLGSDSTDREVYTALMTKTVSVDGDPFILAGNATGSNYTARMEQDPGVTFMPIGGVKDQAEIDKISAWIDAGATFN